jgi:hypothetical protein
MKTSKTSLLLFVFFLGFLGACNKSPDAEVVPDTSVQDQNDAGGPFTANFSAADQTYRHTFKQQIQQDAGAVQYFVTMPEKTKIEFAENTLAVTGCPSSQVKHKTLWIPDAQNMTSGSILFQGLTFETLANTKGIVLHSILGLTGCTAVELKTALRRISPPVVVPSPSPTNPCQGTSGGVCTVKVYCREPDVPDYFKEVEIWKTAVGLSLHQYSSRADGTRNLMTMMDVADNSFATTLQYDSTTSTQAQLKVDSSTGLGTFTLTMQGHDYKTDLKCKP